MTLVEDIKNKYVNEIRIELEKILKENKDVDKRNNEDASHIDYVYRTGIITGLEKALDLIKEYE
jgi:hypothetical protein